MPNLSTTTAKPVSISDRVERMKTPKFNDSEDDTDVQKRVVSQAKLLQELLASFRTSEDMRLLTVERNKQLAKENKRLKDKIKLGSFESVTQKRVRSPTLMSPAEVSTLSMKPSSVTSSSSTITLTKAQMSELAESVAELKEVAFRRENTWERMARRQVMLQKQIKMLRDAAMMTDRQLRDSAQTIKDQAEASKRDQSTIATLKKQLFRLNIVSQRVDKKSSVVEVMAPPTRRFLRNANTAEPREIVSSRAPNLHGVLPVDSPGSRTCSRREHVHDKRDRYSERGHVVDKAGHVVDKDVLPVEKARHHADRMAHISSDRREHVGEKRVDHGSDRRPVEGAPLKQKRVGVAGTERRHS